MPDSGFMAVSDLTSVSEEDSVSLANRPPWPDFCPHQQQSLNVFCKASAQTILVINVKLVLHSTTEAQCVPVLVHVLLHAKRIAQVCDHQLYRQLFQTQTPPPRKKSHSELRYPLFIQTNSSLLKPPRTAAPNLRHPHLKQHFVLRRQMMNQDTNTTCTINKSANAHSVFFFRNPSCTRLQCGKIWSVPGWGKKAK